MSHIVIASLHVNTGFGLLDRLAQALDSKGHDLKVIVKESTKKRWEDYYGVQKKDCKVEYLFFDDSNLPRDKGRIGHHYSTASLVLDKIKDIHKKKKIDCILAVSADSLPFHVSLQDEVPLVLRENQTVPQYYKFLQIQVH